MDLSPVLLGAAREPSPVPGCRCRGCTAAAGAAATLAPSALRFGDVVAEVPGVRLGTGARRTVAAGEAVEHAGIRVIGLPGGATGEVALVLAAPSAGPVLWAPGTAPLPGPTLDALAGAGLTVAALGAGPDGEALARTLAMLRRAGATAPGCDVVAVEVGHATARDRLAPRLAAWGARLAADGSPVGPDAYPGAAASSGVVPGARPPARTLVLGAASSGKSAVAELLLAAEPEVDYLPTGPAPSAADAEWAARVDAHRLRRPPWWRTLEGAGPAEVLLAPGPPLLLDSIGTWVTAALDRCDAWNDAPGWRQGFDAEVDTVVHAWRQARRRVVAVGEETGWGVVPATAAGRRFREALGTVNQRLAAESETVLLVVAGRVTVLGDDLATRRLP